MSDNRVPGELNPGVDLATLERDIDQIKRQFALIGKRQEVTPSENAKPVALMVTPFNSTDLQIVYDDFVKPVIEDRCGLSPYASQTCLTPALSLTTCLQKYVELR